MPQITLCSRCGKYTTCYQLKVVGPTGHSLEGQIFEVCSQKCLQEVVAENARAFGPFQLSEYKDI